MVRENWSAANLLEGKVDPKELAATKMLIEDNDKRIAGRPPLISETRDTFADKVSRELELFEGIIPNSASAAINHVVHNPGEVARTAGTALVVGFSLAAAIKNPGILGKRMTPLLKGTVEHSPKVFGALAVADGVNRVGVPMYHTWNDKHSLPAMKEQLAQNVGTAVVDYGIGLPAGVTGAVAGWKVTPKWINKAPEFNSNPSAALGRGPKQIENEAAFVTKKEPDVKDDVVALYEKSFPIEERQPTADVKELVGSGRIVVHTSRTADGKLHAFSFSSIHDENAAHKFINLDFIATEPGVQSKGVGSLHALRLNQQLKADHPDFKGMTLEMEAVKEPGLPADVLAMRKRRAEFYDRLDAADTNVKSNIYDFEDVNYRGPSEWRAWPWQKDFNAAEAAYGMHINEGGYGFSPRSVQVREFNARNDFYKPLLSAKEAGLMAAPAASLTDQFTRQ